METRISSDPMSQSGSKASHSINICSYKLPKDLERSRLARIFIKITTHLNLQDMFRSCNDHLQLKVELI